VNADDTERRQPSDRSRKDNAPKTRHNTNATAPEVGLPQIASMITSLHAVFSPIDVPLSFIRSRARRSFTCSSRCCPALRFFIRLRTARTGAIQRRAYIRQTLVRRPARRFLGVRLQSPLPALGCAPTIMPLLHTGDQPLSRDFLRALPALARNPGPIPSKHPFPSRPTTGTPS